VTSFRDVLDFSYRVIIRYPAKNRAFFAGFLTEVALKRASAADGGSSTAARTSLAAVP